MGAADVPALSGLRGALADPASRMLGTFVLIPRVEVIEIIAAAGFDLVVLDAEHGPFGLEGLPPLIAAAQGAGLYAVVRAPYLHPQVIGALCDLGADGILVPHVSSGMAARDAVAAARYPPEGGRSLHNAVRSARYGYDPDYLRNANRRVAVLLMCEDLRGVAAIDDLIGTAGADAIFVGPFDLSAAMGQPGRPSAPEVAATVDDVLQRTSDAGLAATLIVATPEAAGEWFARGARMVCVGVDSAILLGALGAIRRSVGRPSR